MFMKWAKEVFGEWWKKNDDNVTLAFTFWSAVSWIVIIASLLDEKAKWVRYYLFPIAVITGAIPTIVIIGWRIGVCIRNLYLDYSYYSANGGKRKREESDSKNS